MLDRELQMAYNKATKVPIEAAFAPKAKTSPRLRASSFFLGWMGGSRAVSHVTVL